MPKLRVHNFAVSLDGYAAGPDQALDDPLGVGGTRLHEWVFATAPGRRMLGLDGGAEGVDADHFRAGEDGIGATIMGRNMFGPIRGDWPDESWTGWWGEEPPYHHPVFVLTHHLRPSIEMQGGTTFHFTDDPIEVVLARAFEAAGGQDVRLGGGTSTVQQHLRAGLVDHLHLAVVPIVLGAGERVLDGLGTLDGYECVELITQGTVAHVHLAKRA